MDILKKNAVVESYIHKSGEACLRIHRRTQEMVNKIALNEEFQKKKEEYKDLKYLKDKLITVIQFEMPWIDTNADKKWQQMQIKAGLILPHAIKITNLFEKNTYLRGTIALYYGFGLYDYKKSIKYHQILIIPI